MKKFLGGANIELSSPINGIVKRWKPQQHKTFRIKKIQSFELLLIIYTNSQYFEIDSTSITKIIFPFSIMNSM
jgi:vacuolar-type H+-ATPase subunit I/STV1